MREKLSGLENFILLDLECPLGVIVLVRQPMPAGQLQAVVTQIAFDAPRKHCPVGYSSRPWLQAGEDSHAIALESPPAPFGKECRSNQAVDREQRVLVAFRRFGNYSAWLANLLLNLSEKVTFSSEPDTERSPALMLQTFAARGGVTALPDIPVASRPVEHRPVRQ